MLTRHRTDIYVSALTKGRKIIVPQSWLGNDTESRYTNGNSISAAEYHKQMQLPPLAVLMHAYFGRNQDDSFVSPDYRQSVLSNIGDGEWTSTFLLNGLNGIEIIESPEIIAYRKGVWEAEGGKRTKAELPPEGWIVEYDRQTGFPIRTSPNFIDAWEIFGDDASLFYVSPDGLRAVLRDSDRSGIGPCCVNAAYEPDYAYPRIRGRECHEGGTVDKLLARTGLIPR